MKLAALLVVATLPLVAQAQMVVAEYQAREQVAVRVHFQSQRRTIETCNELNSWSHPVPEAMRRAGNEAIGCVIIDNVARACDIYAPRPDDLAQTDRFATLGHETLHCFIGRFHTE